jgi:hypothetical protein
VTAKQDQVLSLFETIEVLRQFHRSAPFLFFNGNAFGEIARRIVDACVDDSADDGRISE